MNINELYNLVESFYGYKVKMRSLSSSNNEVTFILYDSFLLKCDLNDRYGRFGFGLELANGSVLRDFLGKHCSLNSDEKSIKESLQIVDDYCRLRLPDKFLDAHYKAYVLSQYEDCDL